MSFLTDGLSKSVAIDGKNYPLRTDFRTWLRFGTLLENENMTTKEKLVRIFDLCFVDETPHNVTATLAALKGFYCANETLSDKSKTGSARAVTAPTIDFEIDAPMLYAAYRQCYGIDLADDREALHWHVFLALLRALPENCRLAQIMTYRATDLTAISSPELRKQYADLKERFVLPDRRNTAQRQADIDEAIADGFEF